MNHLYFGDNLEILKQLYRQHPDGFIDLIYIDPPFNSKRDYNILFENVDLEDSTAQKQAFADTWSNVTYYDTLQEIQEIDLDLYNYIDSLDKIRVPKSAVAYLTTMAIRIWYIHKMLRSTGSFYMHCDSEMCHYLKILCDLIFSKSNFKNEIVWKRTSAHNDPKKFGRNTDRILFYTKTKKYTFNPIYTDYDESYLKNSFKVDDKGEQYTSSDLTGAGITKGESNIEWKGYKPSERGRHWAIPNWAVEKFIGEQELAKFTIKEKLDILFDNGLIKISKNGVPRFNRYLYEMDGAPAQELWSDIPPLSSHAKEKLGYPTQKPETLLERIMLASSNEGDLVADFFCGCGTTIAVAQRLKRKWIGVDISNLAVKLIYKRLLDPYRVNKDKLIELKSQIHISGIPVDIASAKSLAKDTKQGRLGFQDWIIEMLIGGVCNPKKTADGGWDGHITFKINGKKHNVLIEVKSGNVNVKNLREFIQVVNKQNASIGVFVCFKEQVTKPMIQEAKQQSYFDQKVWNTKYDKIQILTVEDLLNGEQVKIPYSEISTFKKASKLLESHGQQTGMFD